MTIVTAYDTPGVEGLQHSLLATKATLIFLEPQLLPTFLSTLSPGTLSSIKTIIYNTEAEYEISPSDLASLNSWYPEFAVYSWEQFRHLGVSKMVEANPPQPSDLACVMYTSGSTDPPKGVKLTHANIVSAIAGIQTQLRTNLTLEDSVLVYLPLAHIFEFAIEQICFFFGLRLGYGSLRTLSDASMRGCKGDIREFGPSLLVGVPAVWESVRKGVVAKVESGRFLTKKVLWGALKAKT